MLLLNIIIGQPQRKAMYHAVEDFPRRPQYLELCMRPGPPDTLPGRKVACLGTSSMCFNTQTCGIVSLTGHVEEFPVKLPISHEIV